MTEFIDTNAAIEPFVDTSDVGRAAQKLPADLGSPRALRIRAGDVSVELEWTERAGVSDVSTAISAAVPPVITSAPDPGPIESVIEEHSAPDSGLVDFCSPTVGTFYRAPEPGAAPFVGEGDQVRQGQQIGIVEAMKLMIPLEAECEGKVAQVLVEDNTPVEFGTRLFTFIPVAAG